LAVFAAIGIALPALPWPWHLLIPLLTYAMIVAATQPLRRTMPRLSIGRIGGLPLAYAVLLTAIAVCVLITFHFIGRPNVYALRDTLPLPAVSSVFWAGVSISLVNAMLEETVFRGILWELVAQEWNNLIALATTSFLFGVGHLNGYPPGLLGASLAIVFGVLLGLLRWWAAGLGLCIACHVCADETIICLLVADGTLGGPPN
jgi:membrane protease YdiL (CAAX protease family)